MSCVMSFEYELAMQVDHKPRGTAWVPKTCITNTGRDTKTCLHPNKLKESVESCDCWLEIIFQSDRYTSSRNVPILVKYWEIIRKSQFTVCDIILELRLCTNYKVHQASMRHGTTMITFLEYMITFLEYAQTFTTRTETMGTVAQALCYKLNAILQLAGLGDQCLFVWRGHWLN